MINFLNSSAQLTTIHILTNLTTITTNAIISTKKKKNTNAIVHNLQLKIMKITSFSTTHLGQMLDIFLGGISQPHEEDDAKFRKANNKNYPPFP